MNAKENHAYVVFMTDGQHASISQRPDFFQMRKTINDCNTKALDLEALRLVIAAARFGQKVKDDDMGFEDEYSEEWEKTERAIDELYYLTTI